ERLLRPPGRALEARLYRPPRGLDRVDPQPRPAPAERDAAEGIAPCAALERADRVPPVPLRPDRRLGARSPGRRRRERRALGGPAAQRPPALRGKPEERGADQRPRPQRAHVEQ